MKYFEEIDAWLTALLVGGEEGKKPEQWLLRVKKEIKDKIWLSYQFGQKSTRKPKPLKKDKQEEPPEPKQAPKPKPKWEPKWADSEEQAIADLEERERKYRELHGS